MEERLRDAFGAAAETVQPGSVGSLRPRPHPARRRRLAPLAAAAAVAVIVVGASVSTPLLLSGGNHAQPSFTGTGASSSSPSASPSVATQPIPNVVGMALGQATTELLALGLRITVLSGASSSTVPPGAVMAQTPPPGTQVPTGAVVELVSSIGPGPSLTYTLQPSRLVTVPADAVTIRIPQDWQRTHGLGPAIGYNGSVGWVQLQAETQPAGIRAACRAVAAENVSQYGHRPYISYRRIDGRPGCQIVPDLVNGALPMTSALVEYRSRLRDGANVLVIRGDPATMTGVTATVKLHH
jgi:hypothetical protein